VVEKHIQHSIILEDSSIIIKLMHKKICRVDYILASILTRAQHEA
jgi:hypothetical protein